MRYRLPILLERSVREGETTRSLMAATFEQQVQTLTQDLKQGLTCSKGCAHCCYYPNYVSVLEGLSLFRWLADQGLWTQALKTKFEAAHQRVWGLSPAMWMLSMVPCPLLNDESLCTAYAARPFTCRTTVSVGDPVNCHPHVFADGRAGILNRKSVSEELEVVEDRLLKGARIPLLRVPISTAVLIGEKVCKEQLEPEDIGRDLFEQWVKNC